LPEITPITSEALQATVRRLLPSQRGFGDDLQATNLIQPIIDLTPTAEGSVLPTQLQNAMAFNSQTAVAASNGEVAVASAPGFYRLQGTATVIGDATTQREVEFKMTDGLSVKIVWALRYHTAAGQVSESCDLYFYLDAGESAVMRADGFCKFDGSVRQVADAQGNLVNPAGFTFE
jgi:hypothetical protein